MVRWRKLGNKDEHFQSWNEAGQQLEGVWHSRRPGKFGDVGMIEDRAGDLTTFALPTILARRLEEEVKVGDMIRITYLGLVEGKSGKKYKDFDIEIGETEPSEYDDFSPPNTEESQMGLPA